MDEAIYRINCPECGASGGELLQFDDQGKAEEWNEKMNVSEHVCGTCGFEGPYEVVKLD